MLLIVLFDHAYRPYLGKLLLAFEGENRSVENENSWRKLSRNSIPTIYVAMACLTFHGGNCEILCEISLSKVSRYTVCAVTTVNTLKVREVESLTRHAIARSAELYATVCTGCELYEL